MKSSGQTSFECEIKKDEFIAAIRHTIDLRYRTLCQAARADWERLFGSDPADKCITVRIGATSSTTRGSGFLKSRRQPASKSRPNASAPGFAH